MKTALRFVACLLGIAAGIGGFLWVYQHSEATMNVEQEKDAQPVLAVHVVPVKAGLLEMRSKLTGSLFPVSDVDIRARQSGYVKDILVDLGDEVEVGQTLVLLDDAEQQQAVATAQATLSVAQAELQSARTQQDAAQRVYDRQLALRDSGAVTDTQLEQAQSTLDTAKAEVSLQTARVRQAESTLQQAKLGLQDFRIVSAGAGVVADRLVDVGDLAQPNEPLMRIVDLSEVQTIVHVTERGYPHIATGQTAFVHVDAWPDTRFTGIVKRIAPVIDPETRTAQVELVIPNDGRQLKPGMHARVELLQAEKQASHLVPLSAVIDRGTTRSVYVLTDEQPATVEQRVVTLGAVADEVAEVTSGLEAGEQVITLGSRLVKNGQEVDPVAVEWPVAVVETKPASPPEDTPPTVDTEPPISESEDSPPDAADIGAG